MQRSSGLLSGPKILPSLPLGLLPLPTFPEAHLLVLCPHLPSHSFPAALPLLSPSSVGPSPWRHRAQQSG